MNGDNLTMVRKMAMDSWLAIGGGGVECERIAEFSYLFFGEARSLTQKSFHGHSAKNDLSMEVLRDFCTRETFLRSVPE
jgi:hypothetical protein